MIKKMLATAGITVIAGMSTLYPTAGYITDITGNNVTVTNSTGFSYVYSQQEGAEDDMIGDMIALIMYNAGTPETIADDIIIMHRYTGFYR